jgi:hypothetical protein
MDFELIIMLDSMIEESVKPISVEREDFFSDLKSTLSAFSQLPDNWDTFGSSAPTPIAIKNATTVLAKLHSIGKLPSRVAPSSDDSIMFHFYNDNRYVLLEFFNDGDIAMLEQVGDRITAIDILPEEIDSALQKI